MPHQDDTTQNQGRNLVKRRAFQKIPAFSVISVETWMHGETCLTKSVRPIAVATKDLATDPHDTFGERARDVSIPRSGRRIHGSRTNGVIDDLRLSLML
jgi:hypothetical protein